MWILIILTLIGVAIWFPAVLGWVLLTMGLLWLLIIFPFLWIVFLIVIAIFLIRKH